MAQNIYTQPIQKTELTAPTTIYTQSIKLDDGEYQTVEFPACLDSFSEAMRKDIIGNLMIRSLQETE